MLATPCYSKDELEKYLHGRAADELSGAIELHLEECSDCEDTLCGLDASDDTLVRTLQVKSGAAVAEGPNWVEGMAIMPNADRRAVGDAEQTVDAPEELGDYELVDVLGRGGMSVVFAARHKHLGRQVALKVLLPTMQQAVSRERFAREMRAVGVLDHPAIVRATDAGECNETLYLVMEQIDGIDLNRISKSSGPLRIADACAIAREVARGLKHAHEQGIVHRDIKPSNIMLDATGKVKILDFGLARMQSVACDVSLQTTMGQLLGTLDYMAPEQASGADVDARADVYALGATLFKLLTGVPPHGRSADVPIIEFLSGLATNEAANLSDHRDQIPGDLISLVAEMLRRDPADRLADLDTIESRLSRCSEDADLLRLATTAIDHRDQAEGPSKSDSDAVKECLTNIWPDSDPKQEISDEHEVAAPPVTNATLGPPSNWITLAAGLASLAGIIYLAAAIILKTPEGDIRIETSLPNISVEIVDEKDQVETLGVEHGAAMTTVNTGRYRIRLDSATDGIEVSPSEVSVLKGKTVIATVREIESDLPPDTSADTPPEQGEKRDPVVAMQAQMDFDSAQQELKLAKQDPEKNADVIQRLEKRLVQLRSLSRPIPTEPVYKGRTMSDWLAQMRFEQESSARKTAAESVLALSKGRPMAEQVALVIEVGTRRFEWVGRDLLNRITSLSPSGFERGSTVERLRSLDHKVVDEQLAASLIVGSPMQRHYALYACIALRSDVRGNGDDWAAILRALNECVAAADGDRPTAKLVYANCIPDSKDAAAVLQSIDTTDATSETLWMMLNTVEERGLPVARHQMIAWSGLLFDRVPADQFYRGFAGLQSVDWKGVDVPQPSDLNDLIQPLLKSFEDLVEQVAGSKKNKSLQLKVANKCRKLTRVIHDADLTGDAKAKSVAVLNRRLEQLLDFRSAMSEVPDDNMDTPAQISTALVLLTGEVPAAVEKLALEDTNVLATTMGKIRVALIGAQGVGANDRHIRIQAVFQGGRDGRLPGIGRRGGYGGGFEIRNRGGSVEAWYPFELIDAVAQSEGGRDALHNLSVDPLLMIASLDAYPGLAKILNASEIVQSFGTQISEHAALKDSIRQQMENATDQNVMQFAFALWISDQPESVASAKLLGWLQSDDIVRLRFALNGLVGSTPEEDARRGGLGRPIREEWANPVAEAIDRIAEKGELNTREISHLYRLKDKAPNAAKHAAAYLKTYLASEERRTAERNLTRWRGRDYSFPLSPVLKILKRDVQDFAIKADDLPESLSKTDMKLLQPYLKSSARRGAADKAGY